MKKALGFMLALTLSASVLGGCGGGKAASTSETQAAAAATTQAAAAAETATEAPTEAPAPEYLDTLTIGISAYPTNLDPSITVGNNYSTIENQIFDRLLYNTPDGVTSYICESWEQIDDLTHEFKLKSGITFHDGSPLTAEDVKFSFDRHLLDADAVYSTNVTTLLDTIESAEAVDDLTFRLHLKYNDPTIYPRLGAGLSLFIIPSDYFEAVGKDQFAIAPIGTGPYKLTSYTPEEMELTYYDGYYGEKPLAETIIYKKVTEESAKLAGLVNGELDIALTTAITTNQAAKAYDNLQVVSVPHSTSHMIRFDTADTDKYLRQAMSLSMNRQLVIDTIFAGEGSIPNGYNYPVFGDMYIEDYPYYEYNVEKAKELLDQSSYNGEELIWQVRAGYYDGYEEAAEAFVDMWKDIGINVKIETLDKIKYNEDTCMTPWSNGLRFDDPIGGLTVLWGKDTTTQNKLWKDVSPRYNELDAQLAVETDLEKRREAYREMLEIWDDEVPGIIMYCPNQRWIVREGLEWTNTPGYSISFRAEYLKLK